MKRIMHVVNYTTTWMSNDYNENRKRFILEIFAWALSISCALTMALTVPNPPLLYIYPIWMTSCVVWIWAAYTRGSTGLLANYSVLFTIDCIGLARLLLN